MAPNDGDLIAQSRVNNNILDRIRALELALAQVQRKSTNINSLDQLSDDLGEISAGRFIASSEDDPLSITDSDTDGNAPTVTGSGVVIDGEGIPVEDGGDKANIIGYGSAVPTVYIKTSDGLLYAANGSMIIGSHGAAIDGLNYLLNFSATNDSETRVSHFGMVIGPDGSTPALAILFDGELLGSELVTNGDAETGDLTGWTQTGSHYAAKTDGSGTISQPPEGTYYFEYGSGASDGNSQLTSSRITAITAGLNYTASCWVNDSSRNASAYLAVQLFWYNNTSGGTLLRIDNLVAPGAVTHDTNWHYFSNTFTAPTGALSVSYILIGNGIQVQDTFGFDAVSLKQAAGSTRQIAFQPDPTITNGGWGAQELTAAPTTPLSGYLLDYATNKHNRRGIDSLGMDNVYYKGDVANYALVATNATTQQTVYSRTIKANSMGISGGFTVRGAIVLGNGAGGGGRALAPLEFNLGGTTIFTFTPSGTGSTANRFVVYEFVLSIRNSGATNSQICTLSMVEQGNVTSGTGTVALGTVRNGYNATTTIDTTADKTFSIYGTPSNTGTTLYREYVEMMGPYYSS